MGQEFECGSSGWFWPGIFNEVTIKMLAEAVVTAGIDWSWRIHFQNGSLTS